MKPRILLAVDGSETSTKAVKYVGEITRGCEGIDIMLYHVLEIPPMLLEHGESGDQDEKGRLGKALQEEQKKWEEKKREQVEREIFAPAKQILKEKGVREGVATIRTKLATGAYPDVALAIIQEVKAEGCGTVVLGKRGISMLREFMFGSVDSKVVHHIEGCAIWIVE